MYGKKVSNVELSFSENQNTKLEPHLNALNVTNVMSFQPAQYLLITHILIYSSVLMRTDEVQ